MKRLLGLLVALLFLASAAVAAEPQHYQVTGPLLNVTNDVIVVEKGKEKWEIARNKDTQVYGDLKNASRVTVHYTMLAKSIAVKESSESSAERVSGLPSPIFKLTSCDRQITFRDVRVDVPKEVDLSNENTARQILEQTANFAAEKCPSKETFGNIRVWVYQAGEQFPVISARNYDPDRLTWFEYNNEAVRRREEQARVRKHAEERARWEAQQRAEQARQARERTEKEAARQRQWNDFVRKYGVQELVDSGSLFTNPFLYQGKTVAVTISFDRMMTANSGVFEGGNGIFVVSNIPTDTYRSKRGRDLLAVRFIGMTEIKGLPMVSSMQVPNLRLVGVHFCQEWSCSDILAQR